jgi:hypothetical protein
MFIMKLCPIFAVTVEGVTFINVVCCAEEVVCGGLCCFGVSALIGIANNRKRKEIM